MSERQLVKQWCDACDCVRQCEIARLEAINAELLAACQKLVRVACLVPQFTVGDGLEAKEAGIVAIKKAKE